MAMRKFREGWRERGNGGGVVKEWERTGHSPKDRRKAGAFADLRPVRRRVRWDMEVDMSTG